jgi:membrane dipeptidase
MLVFDAHLDLAMNAMEWNRDLTQPIAAIRQREAGLNDKPDRGRGTVCFPEMRRGGVGICVATRIARYVKPANRLSGWHSPAQAWAQTQGQFAWYRAMEELGELVKITEAAALQKHVRLWEEHLASAPLSAAAEAANDRPAMPGKLPIGYILSLEGADSLISLQHLQRAYGQGLRIVGPAHYGPGTYAQGTNATGGLSAAGKDLLREMDGLKMILDVTHLCDESFWEAIDLFHGPTWASHSNCRALVPHHRQLSDEQIKVLIERQTVIGVALDAWMLVPGWVRSKSTPESTNLKLERIIDHIDRISQIAGNARHCGIGSDLDGGFGREQTAADLNTIADLSMFPELLRTRGYHDDDISQILHGNFVGFLQKAWTEAGLAAS